MYYDEDEDRDSLRREGELVKGVKSSCCEADVYGGYCTPIDTAKTMFCIRCLARDKGAEQRYRENRS